MKSNLYRINVLYLIIWGTVLLFLGCKKEEKTEPRPTSTTKIITDPIYVGEQGQKLKINAKVDTVINIKANSAQALGEVTQIDPEDPITVHGHCWSTVNKLPTIGDSSSRLGKKTTTGRFITELTLLKPKTTYYIRSYIITQSGIVAYLEKAFVFATLDGQDQSLPSVATGIVVPNGNSVTVKGEIQSLGTESSITEHGHCWSETNSNPTVLDNTTKLGSSDQKKAFESTINNLEKGKKYFFRAYATSKVGTAYGQSVNYTAPAPVVSFDKATLTNTSDGDLIVEPNETVTLSVAIRNTGSVAAEDVVVNISESSGHASNLSTTTLSIGTINGGGSKTGQFTFIVNSNAPRLSRLRFQFGVRDNQTTYNNGSAEFAVIAPIIITNNLLLYYDFEDFSLPYLKNQVSEQFRAFYGKGLTKGTSSPDGSSGSGAFDGTRDAYANINEDVIYSASQITLNTWFGGTSNFRIAETIKDQFSPTYLLFSVWDDYIWVMGNKSNGRVNTVLLDNRWHMLTMAYDKGTRSVKLYIDGTYFDSIKDFNHTVAQTSFRIGSSVTYNGPLSKGSLDNFRVYNRLLSDSEILQLYQAKQ